MESVAPVIMSVVANDLSVWVIWVELEEFLHLSDDDDGGIDGLLVAVVVLRWLRTENEEDEVVRNEEEDMVLIDEQSNAMFRVSLRRQK